MFQLKLLNALIIKVGNKYLCVYNTCEIPRLVADLLHADGYQDRGEPNPMVETGLHELNLNGFDVHKYKYPSSPLQYYIGVF